MGGKLKKPIKFDFDLLIIGAGSAGCVAANDAASRGKKVGIIEQSQIGGECPNITCIPTKALLETVKLFRKSQNASLFGLSVDTHHLDSKKVQHYKNKIISQTGLTAIDSKFSDKNIKLIKGKAFFLNQYQVEVNYKKFTAKNFLVATGSSTKVLAIPGLKELGYLTYTDLSENQNYPSSVCFLGGGAVAYEYSQILTAFGVKVHIIEQAKHILPEFDTEVSDIAAENLQKLGVKIHNDAKPQGIKIISGQKAILFNCHERRYQLLVDEIVVSAGKSPNIDLKLENAGIKYDTSGIKINSHCQTSAHNIFAAGEVAGMHFTAGSAIKEAQVAIHNMYYRKKVRINNYAMPLVIYGSPELATTGITESQMKLTGEVYQTAIAPIGILGKSITTQFSSGFVKLIANHSGVIIGGSVVGPNASEIINHITFAIKTHSKACDIATTNYSTPSWSEALKIVASKIYCI